MITMFLMNFKVKIDYFDIRVDKNVSFQYSQISFQASGKVNIDRLQ